MVISGTLLRYEYGLSVVRAGQADDHIVFSSIKNILQRETNYLSLLQNLKRKI